MDYDDMEGWVPTKPEKMEGKEILEIQGLKKGSKEVNFISTDGEIFKMTHIQDSGENVSLEEFSCSFDPSEKCKILKMEIRESIKEPEYGRIQWTMYDFQTDKGFLQLRWYGVSNGWYSEDVDILSNKETIPYQKWM